MRWRDASTRLVDAAACLLLLALLASVSLGVVFRALGSPLVWSDEMAQYLLVWTGFAGWMIAARNGNHIRINVLIDMLPRPARLGVEVVVQLAMLAFAGALLWNSPPVIQRNLNIEWVSLPISAALLYIPVPIAALALAWQALHDMLDAIRGKLPVPTVTRRQAI
jgi:TRAP-type C4-dicarboxylate transport system permease small subunit